MQFISCDYIITHELLNAIIVLFFFLSTDLLSGFY